MEIFAEGVSAEMYHKGRDCVKGGWKHGADDR